MLSVNKVTDGVIQLREFLNVVILVVVVFLTVVKFNGLLQVYKAGAELTE